MIDLLLQRAKTYGFTPIPPNIHAFIKKTNVIPLHYIRGTRRGRCDLIIAENLIEFAALRRARSMRVGNQRVQVISPEDLFLQKAISDRPKDIEDARSILQKQKGKLDKRYISGWLRKIRKIDKKFRLPPQLELQ